MKNDINNREVNLTKKRIFIIFICILILIGSLIVYKNSKKNDDKLGEELDQIMSQIDDLKAQYDSHCNTDEAKNSQKCKDLEAKLVFKSNEWREKGFGGVDYNQLGREFEVLQTEICTKCDREYLGQADDPNCENLKNEFYSKLRDLCTNEKINPRVCSYIVNLTNNQRTDMINKNTDVLEDLSCKYGSLIGCYLKALHTENLEEQKQILQENCQKSHQKSCDKLKEIK